MKKSNTGFFITFEGTEGSGKSTLIKTLIQKLPKSKVLITREPGGTPAAEKLRQTILQTLWSPTAELLLYEAARAEHVAKVILPALKKNKIVFCDRFTDSTLAYQGAARGLDWKMIEQLNAVATGGLQPDLTVFLDIDPEKGLRRATDPNRFEAEGIHFQKKVRTGLMKSYRKNLKRFLHIKIYNQSPEELAEIVLNEIELRLSKKRRKSS